MKRITVKGIMDMMKKEITHSDFGGIDVEERAISVAVFSKSVISKMPSRT
jgi:hypothetical protein